MVTRADRLAASRQNAPYADESYRPILSVEKGISRPL
jgi:hypothetical protein